MFYPVNMDATDGIELAVLRAERGSETGSAETLEEIFRAEYPRLVGIVVRVTGDRARADGCTGRRPIWAR